MCQSCAAFPSPPLLYTQDKILLLVFQTLFVEPGLCLCDCPGLVMPSFVSTKAEMICNGILPIDQMRDHVPPISLISFLLGKDPGYYVWIGVSTLFWTLSCIDVFRTDNLRIKNLKYLLVLCPGLCSEIASGLQNWNPASWWLQQGAWYKWRISTWDLSLQLQTCWTPDTAI